MLTKVDVFAPPENSYKVLQYMTEMIAEALVKQGVRTRLFDSRIASDPLKFTGMVLTDRPDCTLSINGLLPDAEGNFLCDLLGIPHVALLHKTPQHFFSMVKSPLTILCCADQFYVRFLKLFGDTHALFLPHAADGNLQFEEGARRPIDVVMLGSYIDPEEVRQIWSVKYSSDICQILDESVELTLSRPQISYIEAFCECMKAPVASGRVDPKRLDYAALFNDLESYVRAVDKLEVLQAIEAAKVHVYGEGDWERFAKSCKGKIIPHDPISFTEAIDVMKQSKIVLNSSPQLKYGGHERFYTAYMCGALPLSAQTPFLEQDYVSGEDAVYYQPPRWGDVNTLIDTYLNDQSKREEIVDRGRHITHEKNTWDNRIQTLLDEIPPILDLLTDDEDDDD